MQTSRSWLVLNFSIVLCLLLLRIVRLDVVNQTCYEPQEPATGAPDY